MANIIKLDNGSTIQVRTGVLAGIGPQGPRGLVGPMGLQGQPGPTGETGPTGSITQYASKFIASTQSIAASSEALVAFATVAYDDIGAQSSTTAYTMPEAGDYVIQANIKVTDFGTAGRLIFHIISSIDGRVASSQLTLDTGWNAALPTGVVLPYITRAVVGEVFNIKMIADAADTTITVSAGSNLSIVRIGPGPQGEIGPTGADGPIGPQGEVGPQGDDGDAGSGYSTYDDLLA